ncbi:hypothetical protein F441_14460 [Phytophthora nicotianae CJ01A1]|uniref:RxLR effector protein n=5 Tax=Phytophthora nicotianae TaxID=4792 RepID=W2XZC7_PHYNI|nr:hypothetical protein L916_03717 [Phytophthora nicotianae]ETM52690.1 hypothetical protein L914_03735 [Phytophthora nicotianae]ETO68576.1 hypothetical protein F444_14602 [Phytophthora nicotianae P1976]ETP09706.1 hypothetical protein F441_14460 [Phytophthora nicotianae CJ01A1]ETP27852.1 hypothetical protein F442_22863 [Phytophthora nicotianae P10297]
MRLSTILLAITIAALASASGASTTDLSKTASIKLEHSSVVAQANINIHRRLRKHDSHLDEHVGSEERANFGTWLSENMAMFKAFLSKVDEMDVKAAQMLKGKTVEEAEEVLNKLTDDILPLLENMERKGITPQNLGNHPTFKKLSKEEATHLKGYFDLYWKTFKGNNV